MVYMKNALFTAYFVLLILLLPQAHAYLDPGNGSMFLQLLLGGFAGVGVIVRLYWKKIEEICQSVFTAWAQRKTKSDIPPNSKKTD